MKKFITLLLAILVAFTLVGCSNTDNGGDTDTDGGEDTTDLTGKPLRILQFVSQTLGSLSCEDLIYEGIQEFCEDTGSTVETFECNFDTSHATAQLAELCSSGKYDVVVTGYWDMQEYIQQAALDFPDVKFLSFDCTIDFDTYPEIKKNVSAYFCKQNSLAFAAGALAALISTSGEGLANPEKAISFVGGGHVTAIDDFLIGYIQGAQYVDPEMQVYYAYVGDWENTGKARELAEDHFQKGADVSFGVCAPASFGVCEAAYNQKAYAFGVDTDHSSQLEISHPEQAEYTVSSAVKQFGYQIRDALYTIYDGTMVWGSTETADFDSGYLTMVESNTFKKVVIEGMPDVYAKYQEIVADLAAGKIEVGTAVGATEEYVKAELAKGTIAGDSQ
jgi:basic membrane protein A and related proteins